MSSLEATTAGSEATQTLLDRNQSFAKSFDQAELPILPKLRAVILTCADARVDPAHVLGLDLGDAVVIRNTGGRVTPEVIQEVATLAFMVSQMQGGAPATLDLVLMQHTNCGAERFADPTFQQVLKAKTGVDVAPLAISNHDNSLREDLARLQAATKIPGSLRVSGLLYDVTKGEARQVFPAARLRDES